MKKKVIIASVLLLFVLVITVLVRQTPQITTPAPEDSEAPAPDSEKTEAPNLALTIARLEIAGNVMDRAPVNIASSFPANQEKVYCYLEFRDVKEETAVTVVWSLEQNEVGKTSLTIKPYARFRTWASKSLHGMKGNWNVDVLDEEGVIIRSVTFTVE
jgi:hypothetical protein